MKQTFLLLLSAVLLFSSCKKKEDPEPDDSTVEIGGTKYPIVAIGTQSWTTVNYNGTGGVNYNNGNNDPSYGKLYTLAEAKAIQLPSGWRLPTKDDIDKLLTGLGGVKDQDQFIFLDKTNSLKLMGTTSWTALPGTNTTKFNGLAAGSYNSAMSIFWEKGESTHFWTSTVVAGSNGMFNWTLGLWQETATDIEAGTDHSRPSDKLSIRFVKDN